MSEQAFRIFIVDDDPVARMIAMDQLGSKGYELVEFDDGASCIEELSQKPDLILMDVEMPTMDGITACRKIREGGDDHVQVVFISAHDDIESRLSAYDAGGTDFISKPFSPEELEAKVCLAEKVLHERQGLSERASYAQKAAFTAMSTMGETGAVLNFLRNSFACSNLQQLADELLGSVQQFVLEGAVSIRGETSSICYSQQGPCTPLEESILENAKTLERIFQFRDRMSINYPHVTLIIKQLPLDDEEKVGRLRDHLALIVEAADARVSLLENSSRRLAQAQGLIAAAGDLSDTLMKIEEQQTENSNRIVEAGSLYLQGLEDSFMSLGLTEEQEVALLKEAQQSIEHMQKLQTDGDSLADALRDAILNLRKLASD